MEPTESQLKDMRDMKAWYPYRIVAGVLRSDTGEFEIYAKPTMHTANRLAREGHTVWVLK